jgi:hypothetical protein
MFVVLSVVNALILFSGMETMQVRGLRYQNRKIQDRRKSFDLARS